MQTIQASLSRKGNNPEVIIVDSACGFHIVYNSTKALLRSSRMLVQKDEVQCINETLGTLSFRVAHPALQHRHTTILTRAAPTCL